MHRTTGAPGRAAALTEQINRGLDQEFLIDFRDLLLNPNREIEQFLEFFQTFGFPSRFHLLLLIHELSD